MSYQSPIHVFHTEPIIEHLRDEFDQHVFRAVSKVDIQVDRDELIRALRYDRDQYDKGFTDGRAYEHDQLVTCAECRYRHDRNRQQCQGRPPEWFCADGVRWEEDE